MTKAIAKLEQSIKNRLEKLRAKIKAGDESKILIWAIPEKLACSQRPLRDHRKYGKIKPLPPGAKPLIVKWVDRINQIGIRSIICLLENQQLGHYVRGGLGLHKNGLLGYYESQGFQVRHFPMTDYERPQIADMEKVLKTFDDIPKPVLVHCSAGIDRTTPVAAFIAYRRGKN
jgi:hypothetical protein